jgi:copper(I)-binding protein
MPHMQHSRMVAAAIFLVGLASTAQAEVVASDGWSRATPPGAKTAVGYLVLKNTGTEERRLLSITSPVCDKVMLHRSSVDAQGMSRMWPVGSLALRPGETLVFGPNGLHVMFTDIQAPFQAGQKVQLVLQFEDEEKPVDVMLDVRALVPEEAPAGPGHR